MNLVQRLIPTKFTNTRPGYKMTPELITLHETDNPSARANAEAHARLQEGGNSRQASWHVQVDDTQAIQSIPFNEVAWAAGDGANGPGNRTSIHIEICVNSDGDYKKAVANAAQVTKQVMQQFNIPICNVVQHNKWSGKNCPSIMRSGKAGVTWNDFLKMCGQSQPEADSADGKLIRGEQGPNVKQLNALLHELEYTTKTDDLFDQYTEAALKAFQKDHGLPQDAVYVSSVGDIMIKAIEDKKKVLKADEIHRVQIGAFSDPKNAEKLASELKSKGYSAIVVK
jgi:N-acetyl-anhydromuramyl-L-alanine amidase AmpD